MHQPASIKLHTMYHLDEPLQPIVVIERHRSTRGGKFPIPKLFQLTEIRNGVAEWVQWFNAEAEAIYVATQLGFTSLGY